MKLFRFLFLSCLLVAALPAYAQLEVEVTLDNTIFLKYEPIMAHVKISNFAGYTIGLFNHNDKPWLSFYVSRPNGEQVDDMGVEYDLQQAQVAGGDTLTVNVNLTPVYNIRAPGMYRVMATVYSASHNKQFRSNMRQFDLTTGRDLWKQTIAILPTNAPPPSTSAATNAPIADENLRTYVIVAKHLDRGEQLYARIEDESKNAIYGVVSLGVLMGYGKPSAMVDRQSHLHVLHQVGSRAFAYAELDPGGKLVRQKMYSNVRSLPRLTITDDGFVSIAGGEQTYPNPSILPLPTSEATTVDTPLPPDKEPKKE